MIAYQNFILLTWLKYICGYLMFDSIVYPSRNVDEMVNIPAKQNQVHLFSNVDFK